MPEGFEWQSDTTSRLITAVDRTHEVFDAEPYNPEMIPFLPLSGSGSAAIDLLMQLIQGEQFRLRCTLLATIHFHFSELLFELVTNLETIDRT